MTERSHRALPVGHWLGGLWVACMCLFAGGGCATATYRATELPMEYAARPVSPVDNANLSRLASHSVRSNQIGVGDLLKIGVCSIYSGDETKPVEVNVDNDGRASVPMIGLVKVAGMTPEEAQLAIGEVAKRNDVLRMPNISVRIEEQRVNRIAVSGAVGEPQIVELPPGNSTLLNAILAAKGITKEASAEVIIQRPARSPNTPDALRGNPLRVAGGSNSVVLATFEEGAGPEEKAETYFVNLDTATKEGNGVFYLDDGDAVHVKRQPIRKIQVTGLVKSPGDYEIKANENVYLANALGMAGDASVQWADSVLVIRRVPDAAEPVTIKASIRDIRKSRGNILLQENDVVIVEETPITVAFETLKTFFRFSIGSSLVLF